MTNPTSSLAREPEMLTQSQIIKLSIATSLIEAYGEQAVESPLTVAEAVNVISKEVRG